MKYTYLLPFLFFLATTSCQQKGKADQQKRDPSSEAWEVVLEYAKGFKISTLGTATLVEVPQPYQGSEKGLKYLLVQKGNEVPHHDEDVQVIQVPVEGIVCTSTTHIPLLDYLDESDALVGFSTTDYISSTKTREHVDAGRVVDLGVDKELNMERLISLNPDLVMTYSISGDYGQLRQIRNAGIPVAINAEYLEDHPLGRAEWIKFMALFFNKQDMADSVFNEIKEKYVKLKNLAKTVDHKPTVFSGVVYGDIWYMPGGKNNAAKLFEDAGAKYLWSDDKTTGFQEISFEVVYDKAHDADYWIGVASYNTLEELKQADRRYGQFEAFKEGRVYNYNARTGAAGGNEYLELGYLRPDLILEDLIKIFHPELISGDSLYFHKKLK